MKKIQMVLKKSACIVVASILFVLPVYGNENFFNSSQSDVQILFDGKPIDSSAESDWEGNSFGWFVKGEKKQKVLTFINQSNKDILLTISPESTEELMAMPSQLVVKANETSFCTLTLQPKDKEISDYYYDHVVIQSGDQEFDLNIYYRFQTDFRQITIWNHQEKYERIDKSFQGTFDFSLPPMIIKGRMYVELRFFREMLGYFTELHSPGKNIGVTLCIDGNTLYFESLLNKIIVNGEPVYVENQLDIIHGDRMFLPLRFLAEYAGYTVTWDPAEEKVTLLWEAEDE